MTVGKKNPIEEKVSWFIFLLFHPIEKRFESMFRLQKHRFTKIWNALSQPMENQHDETSFVDGSVFDFFYLLSAIKMTSIWWESIEMGKQIKYTNTYIWTHKPKTKPKKNIKAAIISRPSNFLMKQSQKQHWTRSEFDKVKDTNRQMNKWTTKKQIFNE